MAEREAESPSGRAVVVVVAGTAERAGRLATAVEATGARVAVFDATDPPAGAGGDVAGPDEAAEAAHVAALLALVEELFGRAP